MSKGNLFLSQARGKVGSVVFSVLKGQQITRVYNAKPDNPRTLGQQAQRALLANMTKYYKRGTQNFFKFAYEDKTIRESDFNVFARHNMQLGAYMPRMFYEAQAAPALGNFELSSGSITLNTKDYFSGENYLIVVSGASAITTIAQLSAALIADNPNLVNGDIVTMVLADSSMGADMTYDDEAPTWQIYQFYIDTTNLQPISEIGLSDLGAGSTAGTRYVGVSIAGVDRASFGAFIVSRRTSEGLKVSTSVIKGSAVARVLTDWLRGEYMRRETAISFGAEGDAILEGALIDSLPNVTALNVGLGENMPAYAYGATTFVFEGSTIGLQLFGSNLRTIAQGGSYELRIYNADILSDGLITTPVNALTAISTTGNSSSLTCNFDWGGAIFPSQSYGLVLVDGVPVWYGLMIKSE